MQRLLSLKLASSNVSRKLTNNSNSSLLQLSQPHKTFTTLTKPTHQCYKQKDHFFNFSHLTPTRHFYSRTHSEKVHGSLSNPLLSKQFLSNLSISHFRGPAKRLADCRVGFLSIRFVRGYSGFSSSFRSYGRGRGSWFDRLSANDVVLGLILANVGVFMLWRIATKEFMKENFMISLDNFTSGRVHTLITSAFSHIDIGHIVSNMLGLYFFGTHIGRIFGPEYLLKLYLAGAIGGSLFYLAYHAFLAFSTKDVGLLTRNPSRIPGLGASGAVNAIMLLDIFLNPRATLMLDFIIPVPAILLGIFIIGKDVLRIIEGDSNISGAAHLGGAAVAGVAYARLRRGRL